MHGHDWNARAEADVFYDREQKNGHGRQLRRSPRFYSGVVSYEAWLAESVASLLAKMELYKSACRSAENPICVERVSFPPGTKGSVAEATARNKQYYKRLAGSTHD